MASNSCSSNSTNDSAAASSVPERQDSTSYFNLLDRTLLSVPLCLYYTQGCCTNMNDPTHLKAFDHSFLELYAEAFDVKLIQPQPFDYFLVRDLWELGYRAQVPHQCSTAGMELPLYFREWINLKDVYLNFYNRKARGMLTLMWSLKITVAGNHHLGIDDVMNIARVLQRMIIDGVVLQISARRNNDGKCGFLFENRIKW
ncbi:hypothetical protein ACET3Z_022592 [Daucus carota]